MENNLELQYALNNSINTSESINSTGSDLQKASIIQSANESMKDPLTALGEYGREVATYIPGLSAITQQYYNLTSLGNADQSLIGQGVGFITGGRAASMLFEGVSKTASLIAESASKIKSANLAEQVANKTVIYKNGSPYLTKKQKVLKALGGVTQFGVEATAFSFQNQTYADDKGVHTLKAMPSFLGGNEEENQFFWENALFNAMPMVVASGIHTAFKKYNDYKKTKEDIEATDYHSKLNFEDDIEYNDFIGSLNKTAKTKISDFDLSEIRDPEKLNNAYYQEKILIKDKDGNIKEASTVNSLSNEDLADLLITKDENGEIKYKTDDDIDKVLSTHSETYKQLREKDPTIAKEIIDDIKKNGINKSEKLKQLRDEDLKLEQQSVGSKHIHISNTYGRVDLYNFSNEHMKELDKKINDTINKIFDPKLEINIGLTKKVKDKILTAKEKEERQKKINEFVNTIKTLAKEYGVADQIDSDKIIDFLNDKKTKKELKKALKEMLSPKKYAMKQYSEYANMGFHAITIKRKKKVKKKYMGHDIEVEETVETPLTEGMSKEAFKYSLANASSYTNQQQVEDFNKQVENLLINILVNYEKGKNVHSLLNEAIGSIKERYEEVQNMAKVFGASIDIEGNTVKVTTNSKDKAFSIIDRALADFINKNISQDEMIQLNNYLKKEGIGKKNTFGKVVAYLALTEKELNLEPIMKSIKENPEHKVIFEQIEKNIKSSYDFIKNNLSEVDETNTIIANFLSSMNKNIGIKDFPNTLFMKLESLMEGDQKFIKSIIETYKEKDPTLNNLISSIYRKRKDGTYVMKEEFKAYMKLASKKTAQSLFDNLEIKIYVDDLGKKIILTQKESEVNPANIYSNIFKKALDIAGFVSESNKIDNIKKEIGSLIDSKLSNDPYVTSLFDQIDVDFDKMSELTNIKNQRILGVFEAKKSINSKVGINIGTINKQGKDVASRIDNTGTKVESETKFYINGRESTEEEFKKLFNTINQALVKHDFKNRGIMLAINDILEPSDSLNNFIVNNIDSLSENDYISMKSKALINRSEKELAKAMAKTKIEYRNDDAAKANKEYLDDLFNKFHKLVESVDMVNLEPDELAKIEQEKVEIYKELFHKFELGSNLGDIEPDFSNAKSLNDIKEILGDKFKASLEIIQDFEREYIKVLEYGDIINDLKKISTDGYVHSKVFFSHSGRAQYDLVVSPQSNKFSKHFINFHSASGEVKFKDKNEAKLFLISSLRTAFDELGVEDFIKNEDLLNKFKLKGKDKVDFTKSKNDSLEDHLLVLKEYLSNVDESELNVDQIRYHNIIKKIDSMITDPNKDLSKKQIEQIVSEAKPLAEFDGSQNVIGTILAMVSKKDDATGINGHQEYASEDSYERFQKIILNSAKNSDFLKYLLGEIKRNEAKKPAQATAYGQSLKNTAKDIIEMFIKKTIFNGYKDVDPRDLTIERINRLYDKITANPAELGIKEAEPKIRATVEKLVQKIDKLKTIQEVIEIGKKEAVSYNKVKELFLEISEYIGKENFNKMLKEALDPTGSMNPTELDNKFNSLLQKTIEDPNNVDATGRTELQTLISKMNAQVASSISNKDFLEGISYKVEGAILKETDKIKNYTDNPTLRIVYYKILFDTLKKLDTNIEVNEHRQFFETKGKKLLDKHGKPIEKLPKNEKVETTKKESLVIEEIKTFVNNIITSDEFHKTLAEDLERKTNFGNELEKNLENDDLFKHVVNVRNTVENFFKLGEAVTLDRLNTKVDDPERLIDAIAQELDLKEETINLIKQDLRIVETMKDDNTKITYKQLADIFYKYNVSPLRSETFINSANLPYYYTPTNRKMLFVTEKAVNLDDSNMQHTGIAIINKPLTYLIQSIESDSLAKAVDFNMNYQKDINAIIHRFDAVYGIEGMRIAKTLNKLYAGYYVDSTLFDRFKKDAKVLMEYIQNNMVQEPDRLESLAMEVARQKILLNEGTLVGNGDKVKKIAKQYMDSLKTGIITKYKIDENGELKIVVKEKEDNILDAFKKLSEIKKENIKQARKNDIVINQFTNGLEAFQEKISKTKKVC